MTIFNLPADVVINVIFKYLPATALWALERVSSATRAMVWKSAEECRSEEIPLGNKTIKIILSGSVAGYYRSKLTHQFLLNPPQIFASIKVAQEELENQEEKYASNDSALVLINYAKQQKNYGLMLAMVPFDLQESQRIIKADEEPGSLGDLLITAIRENNTELLRLVLAHPNAKDIPCDGANSLINAMNEVMKVSKNVTHLRMLFAHPNAAEIQEDSLDNRLGILLIEAICAKNLELVNEILTHPNASNIMADSSDGIAGAIFSAICIGDTEILKRVLQHQNAPNVSASGQHGLGRNLQKAANSKNPELAKLILAQPNAKDIPATGLNSLTDALQGATEAKNIEAARQILYHVNAHKIPLESRKALLFSAEVRQDQEMIDLLSAFAKTESQ